MSTLVVEVCEVKAVYPHPNAAALSTSSTPRGSQP